jgi:hypothetical protein
MKQGAMSAFWRNLDPFICKAKGATMRVERRVLCATEKSRKRIASSSIVT